MILLNNILQLTLSIFGVIGDPFLGIFTLGMMSELTNQKGAIIGTLGSLPIVLWMTLGQPRPKPSTLPLGINVIR